MKYRLVGTFIYFIAHSNILFYLNIGEDRRVKKEFRDGFRNGIYSSWSHDVVRPSLDEIRRNPRSKSAKLR